MKITDVKAIPLFIPVKEFPPLSMNGRSHAYHVLVKVFTDEGIVGYGEAFRFPTSAVCTVIEEALKPHLVGEDPTHIERLWELMYNRTFPYGRRGIAIHAISGVEIALWDILGKWRNLPVYEMLGGLCKDKIKGYASLPHYQQPDDLAAIALRYAGEGYTAIKVHERSVEAIKAVREAIGPDIVLMMDAVGSWNPRQAVEMARKLEQYDLLWLEEPVSPKDDYDGLAYVKGRSNIMIASGENEYTRFGFREMISKGAVDIIQPAVIKSGGIMELRKIFTLAETWNLQIATHSNCFGPGIAATIHLGLSNMRSEYLEIGNMIPEAPFIQPDLRPEKGYLTLSDKPGLGIEIDEDVVKRYPYTGQ